MLYIEVSGARFNLMKSNDVYIRVLEGMIKYIEK